MATFRKRNGKWQAQIRRLGRQPISKTFDNKRNAEAWARDLEARLDRGDAAPSPVQPDKRTLSDLLCRYKLEVTPFKRSATVETYRINKMLRNPLSETPVATLTASLVAKYRDDRLQEVSGETVRQDMVLLRQVLETARREWGLKIFSNPLDDLRKPAPAAPRQRRLAYADLKRLARGFRTVRNPLVKEAFRFALATGMRRGEILRVEWSHIDWRSRVLVIPQTKNGTPRTIPLSTRAIRLLTTLKAAPRDSVKVFPISVNAFRLSWKRIKERSEIKDFRFHDLRHEAVSRFFEAGLSLPEVALISGHRDPRQLMRYTHLEAARIAEKL